jgi:hypothetical protein
MKLLARREFVQETTATVQTYLYHGDARTASVKQADGGLHERHGACVARFHASECGGTTE